MRSILGEALILEAGIPRAALCLDLSSYPNLSYGTEKPETGSMPVTGFAVGQEESPAISGGALTVSVAVGAGPDQLVFAFDLGQRRVDRGGEARIVELDREVVAVLFGALLPGGAQFNVLRCTAKR